MSESYLTSAMTTLELRLLDRQASGYPVELTLIETKQIFHGRLSADILPWSSSGDSRIDGQSLFNALFAAPEMLKGWGTASGRSALRRLQVRIDPPELHALPWELLRDGTDLLAADADTPFSRYLAVSKEWGQPITARPLRVLAAISNPIDLPAKYDLPAADVNLETQTLRDAIGTAAELTFLPAPTTLDRLEAELRKGYHLLHFIGHGAFNEKKQQAALYLQDAAGNAQRVTDEDFAGLLNRLSAPPHVVVLAACQSAKQSSGLALSGLGPQLVQIGVPAVIAMQENVSVLTARQFAAIFYQRLLDHGTVDLAMNEARSTLITQGRFDAAVPVLFMRLPDGRLWKAEDLAKQKGKVDMSKGKTNKSGGTDINVDGNLTISGDLVGHDRINHTGGNLTIDNRTTNAGKNVVDTGGGTYVDGGVNIQGSKNVKIGGDSVSGDKIVTTGGSKYVAGDDNSVTGWSAKDVENFFKSINQRIDAKRNLDPQDKQDLKSDVKDVQDEVAKGERADESFLERRLRSIKRMAPDILETIVTTLASPQAGLATVIRKVMQKAQT